MRASTISLLTYLACGQGALGFENKFLFPADDGLTFYYMNTIAVEYQSNFTNPTLYTFCKDGENGEAKQKSKTSAPKGNDTVSVKLDFTQGNICWFNLKEDEKKGKLGFNSPHEWNFEGGKKNTTTVEAPTTTAKPTSTTSSSTTKTTSTPSTLSTSVSTTAATIETASSTPTSSAVPVPDTTAASGVKIGIGVGIGLAGLLVMTVIGMLVSRVLRRRRPNVEQYEATSEISLAGGHKPTSVVSYNPVSQFEPSGGTVAAQYDPYRRGGA